MNSYTLTDAEAAAYDSSDESKSNELMRSLSDRFGAVAGGAPVQTEVYHPDGYVIEQYAGPAA